MSRLESGTVAVKQGDVWALCNFYGASSEETSACAALAKASNEKGWVEEYEGAVPDWLGMYAGLEAAAAKIETYDPELVHALLQTREYARAVIGLNRELNADVLEQRVEFRMKRQELALAGLVPTTVKSVIGEAALRYSVGEPDLMNDQISHLIKLSDRVDVRVRPFSAGLHEWMNGSFAILSFRDAADPSVVYTDTHIGARYLETEKQLTDYRKIFDTLYGESIPIKELIL
jgi:hypothetical protein